jgi:hypothetical protein
MTHHPITPPPELIEQWYDCATAAGPNYLQEIADRSAQWGADQELEACCEWINSFQNKFVHAHDLRLVRRPKPPSLKEKALDELHISFDRGYLKEGAADTIRRALEQLND